MYELSALLQGHEGPVRCLCTINDTIISGSQDTTIKIWLKTDKNHYQCIETIRDSAHWVTALISLPSTHPFEGFISGSLDTYIRIYNMSGELQLCLNGHTKGVISFTWCLSNNNQQYLVSGSWDGTARIWDVLNGQCVCILPGHENGVFCTYLPNNQSIITSSTGLQSGQKIIDYKIRFWSWDLKQEEKEEKDNNNNNDNNLGNSCVIHTIESNDNNSHNSSIKSLSYCKEKDGFLSCSNDGTIKLWSMDGELLFTYIHPMSTDGSATLLHNVSDTKNNIFTTSSEDGKTLIWDLNSINNDHEVIQHPTTIWQSLILDNNDIVTASHDNIIRIFTQDIDRYADESLIKLFTDEVFESIQKKTKGQTLSDEEISKLPKWENRTSLIPDKPKVQMFYKDNKVIAAQWDSISSCWVEMGEVTGKNDSGIINGVQYDHVYDVDIEMPHVGPGLTHYRIGYNDGENTFSAARRFLDEHMLPLSYLTEVSDFISNQLQNGGPTFLGDPNSNNNNNINNNINNNNINNNNTNINNNNQINLNNEKKNTNNNINNNNNLPYSYITFDSTKFDKMEERIIDEINNYNNNDDDKNIIKSLINILQDTSHYHSSKIPKKSILILVNLFNHIKNNNMNIDNNDISQNLLPVLDILRISIIHPDFAETLANNNNNITTNILNELNNLINDNLIDSNVGALLSIRFYINAITMSSFRSILVANLSTILNSIITNLSGFFKISNDTNNKLSKQIYLAIITLIFNISTWLYRNQNQSFIDNTKPLLLTQIFQIIELIDNNNNHNFSSKQSRKRLEGTKLTINSLN